MSVVSNGEVKESGADIFTSLLIVSGQRSRECKLELTVAILRYLDVLKVLR